jgi:glycoprotein endo-alpha-1,2-mannosidase
LAGRSKAGAFFWRAVALTGATALVAWLDTTGMATTAAAAAPSSSDGLSRPLVGAYYYLWNPDNIVDATTLRGHTIPSQVPPAALVNSASPQTAARDITNAHAAGVNFFAVDWWPYDPGYSGRDYRVADAAMKDFLAAPNLREMKFAMFYETWNLGFNPPYEATPVTPQMELHFDSDMLSFAQRYFKNPSYLHIGGRPVVYLYLTRTLTGDVAALTAGARAYLEQHGYGAPFFVGDEVYWRTTPEDQVASGQMAFAEQPQVGRIEAFDAVTSYTLYYGDPSSVTGPAGDSTGYPGTTNIAADQRFLLTIYRNATQNKVPVLPVVQPGFNDRGYRLTANHPALPRQWLPGEGPASTLDHFFRCVAIPELDPTLPIVMVTSWDDWNEDTGVEPIPGTPTTHDDSPSGNAYTQGYPYGGEGTSTERMLGRDVALLDQDAARGEVGAAAPALGPDCQKQ